MQKLSQDMLALAKKGELIKCEECDNDYFYPIYVLVKVDKLSTGLKKDKVIPIQAFKCANCGHINRQFDPIESSE